MASINISKSTLTKRKLANLCIISLYYIKHYTAIAFSLLCPGVKVTTLSNRLIVFGMSNLLQYVSEKLLYLNQGMFSSTNLLVQVL
jgi:hypothetical protein